MTANALGRTGFLCAAMALAACAPPPAPAPSAPPDTRAADEAALRAIIKDWAAAAQAKDAAKFVSLYADDAVLMMAGAPDLRGLAAIREGIPAMMQDPAFALSFEADTVEVARSGVRDRVVHDDHDWPGQDGGHRDGPLRRRLEEARGRRLEGRRGRADLRPAGRPRGEVTA